MKKFAALAFALIMMVSGSAFAVEAPTLSADIKVNDVVYKKGAQGVERIQGYTYPDPVVINDVTYPVGTKFEVIKMPNGQMVPVPGQTVLVAAAGGLGVTGAVVIGAFVAALAAAGGGTSSTTSHATTSHH